jgi:hypothetical protein
VLNLSADFHKVHSSLLSVTNYTEPCGLPNLKLHLIKIPCFAVLIFLQIKMPRTFIMIFKLMVIAFENRMPSKILEPTRRKVKGI